MSLGTGWCSLFVAWVVARGVVPGCGSRLAAVRAVATKRRRGGWVRGVERGFVRQRFKDCGDRGIRRPGDVRRWCICPWPRPFVRGIDCMELRATAELDSSSGYVFPVASGVTSSHASETLTRGSFKCLPICFAASVYLCPPNDLTL